MANERSLFSSDPANGGPSSPPSDRVKGGLSPLEPPYWYSLSPRHAGKTIRIARQALWSPHDPSEWEFVQGVLESLARWVLDLPASEKHHHSTPRGLYRHSLEVAGTVLQSIEAEWSERPDRQSLSSAEKVHWLKVAFALGLFHDCGKILDIEVKASARGAPWDPLKESLAAFRMRHGMDPSQSTPHVFRPGRGMAGHERRGIPLVPIILPGKRWGWLRPLLTEALLVFASRRPEPPEWRGVTLTWMAHRVHEADSQSAAGAFKPRNRTDSR
jgi:hypothetical protein